MLTCFPTCSFHTVDFWFCGFFVCPQLIPSIIKWSLLFPLPLQSVPLSLAGSPILQLSLFHWKGEMRCLVKDRLWRAYTLCGVACGTGHAALATQNVSLPFHQFVIKLFKDRICSILFCIFPSSSAHVLNF